jgi:hypothetical protein
VKRTLETWALDHHDCQTKYHVHLSSRRGTVYRRYILQTMLCRAGKDGMPTQVVCGLLVTVGEEPGGGPDTHAAPGAGVPGGVPLTCLAPEPIRLIMTG